MKKAVTTILLLIGFAAQFVRADATWVYAVQLSAQVQSSPPQIKLQWEPDPFGAKSYTVSRKRAWESEWGPGVTLPGSAERYMDSDVAPENAYEYQVIKESNAGYTGYGYIYAGIEAPFTEYRGKLILIVDNTYAQDLANELARLQSDLTGDGWLVVRHDVERTASPAQVKSLITADYAADQNTVKAVFLFGHVPIVRCGDLNVDGHQARPMPADAYYGDMDGQWDNPSYLPSDVELMVGRVDLADMPGHYAPSPWPSEVELLRNYLNKDHAWRHKRVTVPRQAVVGNRFGDMNGQAFAASGYRSFAPLVGPGNTYTANVEDNAPVARRWSSMLAQGRYLWAYGCGGGSYSSMSGLGTQGNYNDVTSTDLVGQDAKAVFVMLFGSWLGEWDTTDNIMRAVLATRSLGLTCSWSGRPHWYYHHMGLGEPIGYSARLTMNNNGLYQNQVNYSTRGVHIALMGDPTLRMDIVAPPQSPSGNTSGADVTLSWSPSADNVLGYLVYRANNPRGPFTRIVDRFLTGTSFTDSNAASGNYTYMIRAVKMQKTPSGTYYNPSQGVFVPMAK